MRRIIFKMQQGWSEIQIPTYSNNKAHLQVNLLNNEHSKYYLEHLQLQFSKDCDGNEFLIPFSNL